MITTKFKIFFDNFFRPIAKLLIALGITPNQLTLACLFLGFLICAFLIITKNIFWFCILIILFGILDAVDGLIARLTGKTTKFGSYLDAMCDRYFETVGIFSVAYVTGYWLLNFLVITGFLLVSYAKARAAMEVTVSNTEWPDWMERTERCLIYVGGLLISDLFPVVVLGHDLFFWTLVILAVAAHGTVLQRMLRARKLIEERD